MLDTLLLLIVSLALALAPDGAKDVELDLLDLGDGRVTTLAVASTKEGFELSALEGGRREVVMTIKRGEAGAFLVTAGGESKPWTAPVGALAKGLEPFAQKPVQTVKHEETEIVLARGGEYVFAKGSTKAVVRRAAAVVRRTGKLVHHAIDTKRKSVDAYLGREFVLEQADGTTVTLRPSAAVSRQTLLELAGKKVEVTGTLVEGKAPQPDEQAPLEPDGAPMKRGGGFEVATIKAVE